jgi:FkbM family methyltransferase
MILKIKKILRRFVRPSLHTAQVELSYTVLGTEYGGWPLLDQETPQGALIYSFGIGEDISFDLAAIEKYGCVVHGFDPTPRSKQWVDRQKLPATFCFHLTGLGDKEGELEFFAPEKDGHVSFSARPAPGSDPSKKITAPVRRLSQLIDQIGTEVPDVLKMDIEGFEYGVIDDILASSQRPHQWLIEFHHRMYGISSDTTRGAVNRITQAGYQLFYVSESGHEYGFVFRAGLK